MQEVYNKMKLTEKSLINGKNIIGVAFWGLAIMLFLVAILEMVLIKDYASLNTIVVISICSISIINFSLRQEFKEIVGNNLFLALIGAFIISHLIINFSAIVFSNYFLVSSTSIINSSIDFRHSLPIIIKLIINIFFICSFTYLITRTEDIKKLSLTKNLKKLSTFLIPVFLLESLFVSMLWLIVTVIPIFSTNKIAQSLTYLFSLVFLNLVTAAVLIVLFANKNKSTPAKIKLGVLLSVKNIKKWSPFIIAHFFILGGITSGLGFFDLIQAFSLHNYEVHYIWTSSYPLTNYWYNSLASLEGSSKNLIAESYLLLLAIVLALCIKVRFFSDIKDNV